MKWKKDDKSRVEKSRVDDIPNLEQTRIIKPKSGLNSCRVIDR